MVVDDEPEIVRLVRAYLERDGYRVASASDGETALTLATANPPDLIVLDLMLPGLSGWDVCRRLRESSKVPIIMLTARDDDFDKIAGLEIGADDYVTKPFNPRELVARVGAVLRRGRLEPGGEPIRAGLITLDLSRRSARLHERELSLTRTEFDLLAALASQAGRVLSREGLLDSAVDPEGGGTLDRSVDSHIRNLRRKLRAAGAGDLVQTVRGVGYRLASS